MSGGGDQPGINRGKKRRSLNNGRICEPGTSKQCYISSRSPCHACKSHNGQSSSSSTLGRGRGTRQQSTQEESEFKHSWWRSERLATTKKNNNHAFIFLTVKSDEGVESGREQAPDSLTAEGELGSVCTHVYRVILSLLPLW